jgi:predicted  nucleic acid-binding Zn-ribbon protein
MLEQSLETEKLEREKIEMNKWNITKDYNAALEEVESLRKDKVTLTASCEQLKADMNTIQQQVEKYQLEIKCLKDEHSAVNPMTDGGSLQQENTVLEGEKEYLMKLSNLKDKVSEKDINIKKLNEQIDELHLKLSSLRRQLNEVYKFNYLMTHVCLSVCLFVSGNSNCYV